MLKKELMSCQVCGKQFVRKAVNSKYCGSECARKAERAKGRERSASRMAGEEPPTTNRYDHYGKDNLERVQFCLNNCPYPECRNCWDNETLKKSGLTPKLKGVLA